jgi:hypothetical protein
MGEKMISQNQKPIIIRGQGVSLSRPGLSGQKIFKKIDLLPGQLMELFLVRNPHLRFSKDFSVMAKKFVQSNLAGQGDAKPVLVYFPWSGELIRMTNENVFFELLTNRNRNLITKIQQRKLYGSCVGIAGLSIGGNMAVSLAYSGFANQMVLSDFDTIETTNLNRIKVGLGDVGLKKTTAIAQKIYEVNPFVRLTMLKNGLTPENLNIFFDKLKKPAVIFEAIDDFTMKVRLRQEAQKRHFPLVMLTNLGDNILVDIERYDLKANLKIFNGLIGGLEKEILSKPIDEARKKKYALELVGRDNVPKKALRSLSLINKQLVGRPQLAGTVTVGSGLAPIIYRKIILSESKFSGRKKFNLETLL